MAEEKRKGLGQRILDVRRSVGYIKKDKDVSTGGGSYKAVTHDMVAAAVRDAMNAAEIISWPEFVSSHMTEPATGGKQWRYEALYTIWFACADNLDEKISVKVEAHAMDNADKAPGKAVSYATKYAMLKLFNIETGENDESRVHDDEKPTFDAQPYLQNMRDAECRDALISAFGGLKEACRGKVTDSEFRAFFNEFKNLGEGLKKKAEQEGGRNDNHNNT